MDVMASTLPLPTRDSQKTPVVVILKDFTVSLYSHQEDTIPWYYINPLLQHLREANQPPRVSLQFIQSPVEHHLTLILIAMPSSFGRIWFRLLRRFPSIDHPLLAV